MRAIDSHGRATSESSPEFRLVRRAPSRNAGPAMSSLHCKQSLRGQSGAGPLFGIMPLNAARHGSLQAVKVMNMSIVHAVAQPLVEPVVPIMQFLITSKSGGTLPVRSAF